MGRPASRLPRELIQDALQRSGGNVLAAARALGVGKKLLRTRIDEYGLWDAVDNLRKVQIETRRSDLTRMIARHNGDLSEIAKALHLPYHTVHSRLVRYGLQDAATAANPRRQGQAEEKHVILSLLRTHGGNITEAARELGLSPSTAYERVRQHRLRSESDELRAKARVPGPRLTREPRPVKPSKEGNTIAATKPSFDRSELLTRLRENSGNIANTARALGVSDVAVRRRIREYGLGSELDAIHALCESRHLAEERRLVLRELHRHAGSIDAAARALKVSPRTLRRWVGRLGLSNEVVTARAADTWRNRRALLALLTENHGNIDLTARELGINSSSLRGRIKRLRLHGMAEALRPERPSPEHELGQIRTALRRSKGVITEAAKALGLGRTTLIARIKKYELASEAAELRDRFLSSGTKRDQRQRLRELLESCDWSVARAHSVAGVSIGTIYNAMKRLGLERPKEPPQQRLQKVIDALRLTRGIAVRAAERLGVSERTFREWCREFDINPAEYRQGRPTT